MRSNKARDLKAIRETIDSTGELRFHLSYGRTGFVCCRMWHPDGLVLGSAGGGGYDKRGAALGEAIALLFPAELAALNEAKKCRTNPAFVERYPGGPKNIIQGLGVHNGKVWLDGAVGYDCMLDILRVLGFNQVDMFNTGKNTDMVLARKVPQ